MKSMNSILDRHDLRGPNFTASSPAFKKPKTSDMTRPCGGALESAKYTKIQSQVLKETGMLQSETKKIRDAPDVNPSRRPEFPPKADQRIFKNRDLNTTVRTSSLIVGNHATWHTKTMSLQESSEPAGKQASTATRTVNKPFFADSAVHKPEKLIDRNTTNLNLNRAVCRSPSVLRNAHSIGVRENETTTKRLLDSHESDFKSPLTGAVPNQTLVKMPQSSLREFQPSIPKCSVQSRLASNIEAHRNFKVNASNTRPPRSNSDNVSPCHGDSVTVSTSLHCVFEVQTSISTGLSPSQFPIPNEACHPKRSFEMSKESSEKEFPAVGPQRAMPQVGLKKIRSNEESTEMVFDRYAVQLLFS
jgi:hypothetical protein